MIKGRFIVAACLTLAAVVAATVSLKPFNLGSNRWELVDPTLLAQLPALEPIAPFIKIEDAVVAGFQDKVYRFRFRVTNTPKFDAAVAGGPLSQVRDAKNPLAGIAQTLAGHSWQLAHTTTSSSTEA
jgi:hypothetical protein